MPQPAITQTQQNTSVGMEYYLLPLFQSLVKLSTEILILMHVIKNGIYKKLPKHRAFLFILLYLLLRHFNFKSEIPETPNSSRGLMGLEKIVF